VIGTSSKAAPEKASGSSRRLAIQRLALIGLEAIRNPPTGDHNLLADRMIGGIPAGGNRRGSRMGAEDFQTPGPKSRVFKDAAV